MGNNPHLGVDPDGGFFFESAFLNYGVSAVVGAGLGALYGEIFHDDPNKYAMMGAGIGLAGYWAYSNVPWAKVGSGLGSIFQGSVDVPTFKLPSLEGPFARGAVYASLNGGGDYSGMMLDFLNLSRISGNGGNNWNTLSSKQKIEALINGISKNNAIQKDSYMMTYDDIFDDYKKSHNGYKTRLRRNANFSEYSSEIYVEFLHDTDFQRFNTKHPSQKQILKDGKYYMNYYFYDSNFSKSMHSKQTLFIQVPSSMEEVFSKFLNIR